MADQKLIVTPGELLTKDAKNWLHGKGTHVTADEGLVSTLCGEIQMMDRMVKVEAASSRYSGHVGDCVVGRVTGVQTGRWKVDLGAHLDAVLQLQNVNLPGGHLRRKTAEDQRQMRELFKENDMVSAEVQKIVRDGTLSLHTRSTRYGKLSDGVLVNVPAVLIKRLKTHFHIFDFGVQALIGVNGGIWVSQALKRKRKREDEDSDDENKNDLLQRGTTQEEEVVAQPLTATDRLNIARVCNSVALLAEAFLEISPITILDVFTASNDQHLRPPEMLYLEHKETLLIAASERVKGLKKTKK